ncbi:hypothetical protein AALO_G00229580, partial [Alosa alosa]
LILFLTLPVTVATSERSFSKLKTIKNHLRSTVGQERLSGFAILRSARLVVCPSNSAAYYCCFIIRGHVA